MKAPPHEPLLQRLLAALPGDLAAFERLCAQVPDWPALLAAAARHGVEALLEYYLVRLPHPPAALDLHPLEQDLALRRLRQARLERPLDEALTHLAAAGIRTVVLKGPPLAARLYPDPSLRPSQDLDLMVAPADLDRAAAALEALGYQAEKGLLARYYRENHHHIHLHRDNTPPLELHFRATTGFGVIVPAEDFLSRASTPGAALAWVLAPEDEFLYLALHAARHLFVALVLLYDLKLFLLLHRDLDWRLAAARARSLRVTRAVSMAVELLHGCLAVPLPPGRYLALAPDLRSRLAHRVLSAVARWPIQWKATWYGKMAFRILLCDHLAWSAWSFRHRLLRAARRRAQRYVPWAVPQAWSR